VFQAHSLQLFESNDRQEWICCGMIDNLITLMSRESMTFHFGARYDYAIDQQK